MQNVRMGGEGFNDICQPSMHIPMHVPENVGPEPAVDSLLRRTPYRVRILYVVA